MVTAREELCGATIIVNVLNEGHFLFCNCASKTRIQKCGFYNTKQATSLLNAEVYCLSENVTQTRVSKEYKPIKS